MSNQWYFVLCGFGFLLANEKADLDAPYSGKGLLKPYLTEAVQLLWQVQLLLMVHEFAINMWLPESMKGEWAAPFYFLGAYGLNQILRRSQLFFICVFCICLVIPDRSQGFSMLQRVLQGILLAFWVAIFEMVFVGLKDKLLFANLPKLLEGLPIMLMTGSLLAMALWGCQVFLI